MTNHTIKSERSPVGAQDISVLFEDDYLVVVNKPSGMVVNRSRSCKSATLQDWMERRYPKIFTALDPESDMSRRSGLVHRLDKGTSGLVILAKNAEVLADLLRLFKQRRVKKEYTALVWGRVGESQFSVQAPIARNPRFRQKQAVVEGGKEALSVFRRERVFDNFQGTNFDATLVTAQPETGRMHQIRVHLAAFGHPVVGDKLYSGRRRYKMSLAFISRIFLHAKKISLKHPVTKEELMVVAPLPTELKGLV